MRLGDVLGVTAVSGLVLCAACLGEPSDPEATGRAAAPDLFSAWPGDESLRLAAEPSLVVGLDESLPLGRVSGAVFFGEGIAIADAQSDEVLILDGAGRLLSRHGRNGDGPGEYRFLAGIARHADGLITWDANHFRLTQLDASGGYVGETNLRGRRGGSRIVGAFGNSVLLEFWSRGFPGDGSVGPMEVRLPVAYEIVRLSDGEIVFEGTRPGEEKWAAREVTDDGQRDGGLPVIFGRTAVAAVTDNYAHLATTDSITITRYDETATAGEVSFEQPRERAEAGWERFVRDTTRASIESIEPGQIFLGGRNFMMSIREFRLGLIDDLPARPTLPPFSAMKGGADGLLWIREYPDPLQDEVVWIGFDEAWERKKRLAMPARLSVLNVLDISEGQVLVWAKGAHDENLVEVYPIEREEPGPRSGPRHSVRRAGVDDRALGTLDLSGDVIASEPVLQGWRAPRPEPPSSTDLEDWPKIVAAVEDRYFEPGLHWDVLPDGTIAYSDSTAYAIKLASPNGSVTRVLRRPLSPEAVSERIRQGTIRLPHPAS